MHALQILITQKLLMFFYNFIPCKYLSAIAHVLPHKNHKLLMLSHIVFLAIVEFFSNFFLFETEDTFTV